MQELNDRISALESEKEGESGSNRSLVASASVLEAAKKESEKTVAEKEGAMKELEERIAALTAKVEETAAAVAAACRRIRLRNSL